ncbi:LysR family transcriptional regulator [Coraliomargarita parva]|uniref:LysR family transcriptional regulator n=1 Tax=Coraliomargarita parva TaxID=3014050 RepID=UPI0022B2BA93|nr:LysR substrate-binding domain-containing protein [Coraliomargarita parva]
MDLRHLRYFIAVAEALNYRQAAERLHVAQPALSRQVKQLEDAIGAKLLERDTGGTSLTEAGAVFLEEARDILERVEMAGELTRSAAEGRRGHLHIAGIGSLSVGLLAQALSAFRQAYPKVEVSLHDIGYRDLLTELRSGSVHLGFSFNARKHIPEDMEQEIVAQSVTHIALSVEHPLAQRKSIRLRELSDETIFCIGEADYRDLHARITHSILDGRKIRHHPVKRIASPDLMMAMIAGNYGVSLVFPRFANVYPRIRLLPLDEQGEDLQIRLSAVWRRNTQARLARNFVEVLRTTNQSLEVA